MSSGLVIQFNRFHCTYLVFILGLFGVRSAAQKVAYSPYCALNTSARMQSEETATFEFDEKMLEYLVCPLSKKPLR